MKFHVRSELNYTASAPVMFLLNIRPKNTPQQRVLEEVFTLVPDVPVLSHTDPATGNRFDQITAQVPGIYHLSYHAVVETDALRIPAQDMPETDLETAGLDVISCLYPSRYCQSDRLGNLAMQTFEEFQTPLEKVQAVVAWITERIAYVSGSTHASTSAVDTLVERQGVCRDFAHLGIALCRSMNIPARYFTGYAHDLNPPDFHACFEAWIGGRWLLWDPTGLTSPDGVVHIGTGKDAAEVSVCTSFGSLQLESQMVECRSLEPGYEKLSLEELRHVCISHS